MATYGQTPRTPGSPTRGTIRTVQPTPPTSSPDFGRHPVPRLEQPEVRLQGAPASPVSISPPRRGIQEPESASIKDVDAFTENRRVDTPDSGRQEGSAKSLPVRSRPGSGPARSSAEQLEHSRHSSWSGKRAEEDGEESQPQEEVEGLQYAAFDDAPKKRQQQRASQATMQSASSGSGSEHRQSRALQVPAAAASRTSLARPVSTYTLGTEIRGRTLTPMSANGSDSASPARDLSSRRSPRPVSYVELLANVPYNQQIAPGGLNNVSSGLQSVVGNAASLLDTKKTLDMYRANVKKTNDVTVQYEFAMFMMNTARDVEEGDDLKPAELILEAKRILQRLADRAYPFAQYYLGDGYFSGVFNKDKPDHDKAFPLFLAASKHGHAEAGYRAALCYEFGWGTGKNYSKAVQFYRNSASKGHPGAATRLGMACLKGDMGLGKHAAREGLRWLKRAQESADFQYNTAPYELGLMHLNGYGDDVFKDEPYAAQLLTQAAELGHVQANFLMGQAYENGLYGCPRDAALSVHFYNGAATRGLPDAMMALCAWYMVGAEPVLEKDEGEACAWAKQAAETGKSLFPSPSCSTILTTPSYRPPQGCLRRRLLHRNGHRLPARPSGG